MNQISKDPFHCQIVALLRSGLKSCTHTHTQHNICPRCTKVKQGTDHRAIYLLIHFFTIWIKMKLTICGHGCLHWLDILHFESLEHVLDITRLIDEGSASQLLHLKTEKELQLSHHAHRKFLSHKILKLNINRMVSGPKDNIINIYLANKQLSFYPLCKESGIYYPNLEPLLA